MTIPSRLSLCKSSSADFEKALLQRYRAIAALPGTCRVFREPWGRSTVLCLDFQEPSTAFLFDAETTETLKNHAQRLGLSSSLVFKVGGQVKGWLRITH